MRLYWSRFDLDVSIHPSWNALLVNELFFCSFEQNPFILDTRVFCLHFEAVFLWYLKQFFALALISLLLFYQIKQNGYPSRRRSLVDDARFETQVVKQTKETVLEEAREKANGMYRKNTPIIFLAIFNFDLVQ